MGRLLIFALLILIHPHLDPPKHGDWSSVWWRFASSCFSLSSLLVNVGSKERNKNSESEILSLPLFGSVCLTVVCIIPLMIIKMIPYTLLSLTPTVKHALTSGFSIFMQTYFFFFFLQKCRKHIQYLFIDRCTALVPCFGSFTSKNETNWEKESHTLSKRNRWIMLRRVCVWWDAPLPVMHSPLPHRVIYRSHSVPSSTSCSTRCLQVACLLLYRNFHFI